MAIVANKINAIIHGTTGSGKTALLGTAVNDKRLMPGLLVDFEGGIKTIRSKTNGITIEDLKSGKTKPTIAKWDVLKARTWDDFDDIYEVLESGDHPYVSVAMDSASEIGYMNMQTIIVDATKNNSKHDPDVPESGDYNRAGVQMRRLIRFFRDLEMNVFFTAISRTLQDPKTRRDRIWPMIGHSSLIVEIPALVDVIGYLAVVETEGKVDRVLLLGGHPDYIAKVRMEGDPVFEIDNPTLPKLLDIVG